MNYHHRQLAAGAVDDGVPDTGRIEETIIMTGLLATSPPTSYVTWLYRADGGWTEYQTGPRASCDAAAQRLHQWAKAGQLSGVSPDRTPRVVVLPYGETPFDAPSCCCE